MNIDRCFTARRCLVRSVIPVCLLFLLGGCDQDKMPVPASSITLLNPVNDVIVDECCVLFEWESSADAEDYRFRLAEDIFLNSVIFDTIIRTTNFQFTDGLLPGRHYYWQIRSESLQAEAKSSFYTTSPAISLLYPTTSDTISFINPEFQWQSSHPATDYHLQVSLTKNFSTSLLDTIVTELQCVWTDILKLGTQYYWKVSSSQLQSEALDSFKVRDYIRSFEGTYSVDIMKRRWIYPDSVLWDTIYPGMVVIQSISGEEIRVDELVEGVWRHYRFIEYMSTGEDHINFIYNDASRTSFCVLNYESGEFYASMVQGGITLRTTWWFTGSK